jgi:hypothetical protein
MRNIGNDRWKTQEAHGNDAACAASRTDSKAGKACEMEPFISNASAKLKIKQREVKLAIDYLVHAGYINVENNTLSTNYANKSSPAFAVKELINSSHGKPEVLHKRFEWLRDLAGGVPGVYRKRSASSSNIYESIYVPGLSSYITYYCQDNGISESTYWLNLNVLRSRGLFDFGIGKQARVTTLGKRAVFAEEKNKCVENRDAEIALLIMNELFEAGKSKIKQLRRD